MVHRPGDWIFEFREMAIALAVVHFEQVHFEQLIHRFASIPAT